MADNTWWTIRPLAERQQSGREAYQQYGRSDALFAECLDYISPYAIDGWMEWAIDWYSLSREELQAIYQHAYAEVEQEKQRDPMRFYLNELLRRLENGLVGEEWYGQSFAKPVWLLKQAMEYMRKEE